jgi:Na+/H+ antiporter NhaD/arsenite permease-like protein
VTYVAVAIFVLTYALIATRRWKVVQIGRPAGALLGAVAMVAAGVLTPQESYAAVDQATIVLLFGMMMLTAYLDRAGFFHRAAGALLRRCRTPWGLLATTAVLPGLLSAVLVNDAVCVFFTPVVLELCRRAKLPFGPFLIALATSANIGSAATLVGNPQNMIIGSLSGYGFAGFLLRAGPAAAAGLAVNLGLLWVYYHRRLPAQFAEEPHEPDSGTANGGLWPSLVVTGGIVVGFFAGGNLGFTVLGGVALLVMWEHRHEPREVLGRVDWGLLVFFCGLFVVTAGLAKTGLVDQTWNAAASSFHLGDAPGIVSLTGLLVAGSNIVSNVPMVLLTGPHLRALGNPEFGWVLLAYVTTVAGNLTLVGSVANIIVAERAREDYILGFREYLKFGFVSTVLVLATGVPILWLTCG